MSYYITFTNLSLKGMDELSEEDKLTVSRARKIQRFLSQPFQVQSKRSYADLLHVDFCYWYWKCLICDNICLLTVSVGRRSLYWARRKTCNHGTNYWRIPRNPYRKIWSPARSRILHGWWHIRGKYKFRISQIPSSYK